MGQWESRSTGRLCLPGDARRKDEAVRSEMICRPWPFHPYAMVLPGTFRQKEPTGFVAVAGLRYNSAP